MRWPVAVPCVLGSPLSPSGSLHSAACAGSSFLPFCRCVESPCVDEPEFINVLTCGFGSGPLFDVMTKTSVCGSLHVAYSDIALFR